MTVTIFELTSELQPQAHDPDYNPNQFSESEDEPYGKWSTLSAFGGGVINYSWCEKMTRKLY